MRLRALRPLYFGVQGSRRLVPVGAAFEVEEDTALKLEAAGKATWVLDFPTQSAKLHEAPRQSGPDPGNGRTTRKAETAPANRTRRTSRGPLTRQKQRKISAKGRA